jgi:hypothetical protein
VTSLLLASVLREALVGIDMPVPSGRALLDVASAETKKV